MPRGGARPGAGRKPGVPAKKTVARLKIAEEAKAGGIEPLTLMLQAMRSLWAQDDPAAKLKAVEIARDCAPYIHPRLSSVDQRTTFKGDTLAALLREIDGLTIGIAADNPDAGQAMETESPLSRH
jgi:hypothetical protein